MSNVMTHYEAKYQHTAVSIKTEVERLRMKLDDLTSRVEMSDLKKNKGTHDLIEDLF